LEYIASGFQLGLKYYFTFSNMNHKEPFCSQESGSMIQTSVSETF